MALALWCSREAKNLLPSRLAPALQKMKCSLVEDRTRAHLSSRAGQFESSKWRKLDSRDFGLKRSMIPYASWTVLKQLREKGFKAYLVGGCVRDLILNKVPKDFDVITTAELKQVKRAFRQAIVVGRRFPICMVTVRGSVVEVSSFDTVAKESGGQKVKISQRPRGCDPGDFLLWENSLHRDFTVNSLFFDPFTNMIYDYTNAMKDLKSLKLRTVKPARLSFKEDTARILRGLRLAARLNLSFSKETEDALHGLSSSVAVLSVSRILMEMNYMLSYGAAERSILLLKRFQLLDILLPFHAAYLAEQVDNGLREHSVMLAKLFFNLDQLVTCDRPCSESLWVAILAFHLAMFSNPQHPIVVLTFASLLHHRTLEESITFARQNALATKIDTPEIVGVQDDLLDDNDIAGRVTQFIEQVKSSVNALVKENCLLESMTRFPKFPCSSLVFIPQKMGQKVQQIFDIPINSVSSVNANKRSGEIRHYLLKEGNINEIRFVLGKIITSTLVHSKEQEAAGGDVNDDLLVKNQAQKSGISEQTQNATGYLHKLFATDERKRSTAPSDYEKKISDNAPNKRRLSKDKTTTGHGSSGKRGRQSNDTYSKTITSNILHSKEAADEDGNDDLLVKNQPQKSGISEQSRNASGRFSKLFATNENERKRSTAPSSYEELSDYAPKKRRLSEGKTTTGHRVSGKRESQSHDTYSKITTSNLLHDKELHQEVADEDANDDLLVKNRPQKSGTSEQTRNASGNLSKLFGTDKNKSKELHQEVVDEDANDDLLVKNRPQKSGISEQTRNASGNLSKLFGMNKNKSKELHQEVADEDANDDLLVKNRPQKSGISEQTRNASGNLSKLFGTDKNKSKKSTAPSNYEKFSDYAPKKRGLSKDKTATGQRVSRKRGSKSHD